jgi:DNA-binding XRE family transcriptional regulator
MARIRKIRTNVFQLTQAEFGALIGASQQAVSAAEKRDSLPLWWQEAIRKAARKHSVPWADKWFFEPPKKKLSKGWGV